MEVRTLLLSALFVNVAVAKFNPLENMDNFKQFRTCDKLEIAADNSLELFELPEDFEDRIPIPFTIQMSDPKGVIDVYLGTANSFDKGVFYVLSLSAAEFAIKKISAKSKKMKTVEELSPTPWRRSAIKHFYYARIKARTTYTTVGVYPAGEEGAEPFITFTDEFQTKSDPLTHYGFALRSDGNDAKAVIEHNCEAKLGGHCVHTVECVGKGTECNNNGILAACVCDEEHVMDRNKCIASSIRIGDPCENSRQCAKLEAKCKAYHLNFLIMCFCKLS